MGEENGRVTDAERDKHFAQEVVRGMYALDFAAQAMGIEVTHVESAMAEVEMLVRKDMLNSHGSCHGGMIFSLADVAFAYACNSANQATVAMSCSITYLSPGVEGERLTARAIERVRQGRNGVYDISVIGGDGRMVAVFQGNAREVRGKAVPGLDQSGNNGSLSDEGGRS